MPYAPVTGTLRKERVKAQKLENELLEIQLAEKRRELIPVTEALALWGKVLLTIRQRFQALPGECAAACNPTDPVFAMRALEKWSDQTCALITKQLPPPATDKGPGEDVPILTKPETADETLTEAEAAEEEEAPEIITLPLPPPLIE